jgi:ubiquinol-cytochrome c reductase iron-sulfur subunit
MDAIGPTSTINRRHLLYWTTGAVAVAGIGAATWPLIDQMNPDSASPKRPPPLEVRLSELGPGEHRILRWREMPILIAHRTAAMLQPLQHPALSARRLDPPSQTRQQPPYAANWHRSADPAYAVLIAICTYCRCVPVFFAEADALTTAGGTICPCCASRFDAAGRVYYGPAQFDLPVPPHRIARGSLFIGRTDADGGFSVETIEQL